jgi:putative Mg2+ transporter-C (MgtC) family protein
MRLLAAVPEISSAEIALRLGIAAVLGAAVGLERELRDREAGLRTHMLVSVGSALFTLASAYGFHDFLTAGGNIVRADPTRIAAQIVTGIGFLGAGAIVREGLSVRGLTTAGSLWVVAGVGMAAGAGFYWAAVLGAAITLIALGPLRFVGFRALEQLRPEEQRLTVDLRPDQHVAPFLAELDGVRHFELTDERDRRTVRLELRHVDEALVARLSELDYVIGIRWRR